MRSLADALTDAGVDLTGWRLQRATGVSADGKVIVGYGANPAGQVEAWRADMSAAPEPRGLGLYSVLAGAAAFAARWRRRRTAG
ncbi:hypothetical protein Pla175_38840 [Pirellulimonas nuda]|uniref:Uncharacterized protein n=1 Tax=Pirellulimonas nuda TaxID=2528009 RepID=A0A518DG92_9BACT|nr:hypothetical protein [Pirellulimonas nuda]QDU90479.1 hypothetical protein Pla175_38840 [Pirellulimonas nuda]